MDRTLPSDIEAERATLGSVFLNREALIVIAPWLDMSHFYLERHAWIYDAMLTCLKRGTPPDTITVSDELRRSQRLEDIGGLLYLIDLANSVPTAVHVERYARIVERTAIARRIITAGGKIAALGFDERDDLDVLETQTRKLLDGALARRSDAAILEGRTLADRALARLNNRERRGTSTGFFDIDEVIGGLQPGEMTVIAGRPSMGKTAFLCSLVHRISRTAPVLIFSLEMTADQLFDRLACIQSGLNYEEMLLRGGIHHDDDARGKYMEALGYLSDLPIHIDETPGLSIVDMQRRALLKTHEVGTFAAIGVDYLQLMSAPGVRHGDEYALVTAASKAMTAMAKTCNAPVLAVSQLSRETEKRGDPRPKLSDLRGSGQIEQDAAIVMFPYREEVYEPDTDKKGIAEIHISKHRNGRTGIATLMFDAPAMAFRDLAKYQSPEGY